MANIVEHKKFICVCFDGSNNNKAWQITLYDNNDIFVEWGRVGLSMQGKTHVDGGIKKFDSLIRSKTNPNNAPDKLYTEVKSIESTESNKSSISVVNNSQLKDVAKKQIIFNDPTVGKFVEFLTDVNAHNIMKATGGSIKYDTSTAQFKTPMGIIVPEQIILARDLLFTLTKMVQKRKQAESVFGAQLNQYLRLIPHDVGMRKIDPFEILPDMEAVQKESDILDGLEASFNDVTTNQNGSTDKVDMPKIFDVELHMMNDSAVIDHINMLFNATKKSMHQSSRYKLKYVYKVIINHMTSAFTSKGKSVGNIKELWHGTKASNLLSILKHGMVIPPANASFCTGRMFSDGLYFSDQSTKSLNYATNYWSGGGNTSRTFMFLADVAMGKEFIPKNYYGRYPVVGYDSTFAKAGVSGVMNNEMIVYKTHQANLKYLCEFV